MSEMDVVLAKINIIKNCLIAIEKITKEENDPDFKMDLYEINLQRAIQACIDLANVIISKEGLGLPNSYRQCFEILGRHHVIDAVMVKTMVGMVGFRNVSVHEYEQVNPDIVNHVVKNQLGDFEEFYRAALLRVKAWG